MTQRESTIKTWADFDAYLKRPLPMTESEKRRKALEARLIFSNKQVIDMSPKEYINMLVYKWGLYHTGNTKVLEEIYLANTLWDLKVSSFRKYS